MRAGGFPGNPGGLVVSIVKTAGGRAPAHQARGRGRRTWRPTERTAGARMVPPGEGNEALGGWAAEESECLPSPRHDGVAVACAGVPPKRGN